MGHDQLFKSILEAFLGDFLRLFFPAVAERLDLATLQALPREVFKNLPDGRVREVDFVARGQTRSGEPEAVLIHVEVQARPEKDFPRRMFEYAALLWLSYQAPVFPIVLYLKGGEGRTREEYRLALFGEELFRFRYATVALARLEARKYSRKGPLGAALAALMQRGGAEEPLRLRAEMLREVAESELDDARKLLLVDVIETYFALSEDERRRFQRLVARKEYRTVQDVELTWAERLREEGRQEGRQEGRELGHRAGLLEGKRDALLTFLTRRFGPLPEDARARIRAIRSIEELDGLLDRTATASSLDELDL